MEEEVRTYRMRKRILNALFDISARSKCLVTAVQEHSIFNKTKQKIIFDHQIYMYVYLLVSLFEHVFKFMCVHTSLRFGFRVYKIQNETAYYCQYLLRVLGWKTDRSIMITGKW